MNPKRYLENRIRGWLPKTSILTYTHKTGKPRWWRPLWIVTLLGTTASGLVFFLILNVPLERVIALLFFAFACIGFAYYIRVRPSIKVNRAVYVMLGISPIGFGLSFAWAFTIGRCITPLLGIWGFFIGLIVPCTIGAFIGDWIGKRRNYQLPLWP
jgi:hypothetical protein